jgi:5-formyltetrahydrofolate cyclo-ligase
VPRAEPRDRQLHLHRYPCELVTLGFGLRQPRRDAPELSPAEVEGTIDAAVVLGLGFDRRGYRLGYGSGYFDRFLAGRDLMTIGLAFDEQLVDRLPTESHDVPMRLVVTPSELVRA